MKNRDAVIKDISQFLSGPALHFVSTQLRLAGLKKHGFRWSERDKALALSIYHTSPKVYHILRKVFALPSVTTLRNIMRTIDVNPGFNNRILLALKQKVSTLSSNSDLCVLLFDEMSVKESVCFNQAKDYVEGLEDFGCHGRTKYVANHVTVFMVRGLIAPWKQAVGYFVSSGPMDSKLLYSLMLECIDKMSGIGLTVKAVIADQGSNNQKMFNQFCQVTEENPFFVHNEKKVHVIYDPPHLIKNIRNNFKRHGFLVNGEEINWLYVEQFYNFDKQNSVRIAPKLTSKHIDLPPFAGLRVKFATQVLSHSVAAGISTLIQLHVLPPEAKETALFIEQFDKLFNCFNSGSLRSSQQMSHALTEKSSHHEFLQATLEYLNNLKMHPTSRIKDTRNLPCVRGWRIAIRSLLLLWEDLHTNHNVKFLLTTRLNQDCLENLFSIIRGKGGHVDNPSVDQFRISFSRAMVDSFFVKSAVSNCMEDAAKCLLTLDSMTQLMETVCSNEMPAELPPRPAEDAENEDTELLRLLAMPPPPTKDPLLLQAEDNVIIYIAGYIVRKVQKKVCINCKEKMIGFVEGSSSEFLIVNKKFESIQGQGLVMPSKQIIRTLKCLESAYVKNIGQIVHMDKVKVRLMNILKQGLSADRTFDCQVNKCETLCLIVSLFINVRLYSTLKDCTNAFSARSARRNRKLMKVCHT